MTEATTGVATARRFAGSVLVTDLALAGATVAVWVTNEQVVAFHLVFLLLVIHAFRLPGRALVVRAVLAGLAVTSGLVSAWTRDELPFDEVMELPLLATMIAVVYVTASRRERLREELDRQRATIETLHRAARRELADQLLLGQQLHNAARLTSAVVHDANNTLGAARLAAEALHDRPADERTRELGTEIEQAVDRTSEILHELLPGAGPVPDTAATDLDAALDVIGVRLRRLCGDTARIEIDPRGDGPLVVGLGAAAIEQIVTNLVTNSLDALGDRPGRISVVTRRDDELAVLTITDDGPGIPDEVARHVFEPTFTTKPDGNGLGLYSARELARAAGGELTVARGPDGEGTVARLALPLVDRAARPSTTPAGRAALGRPHQLRVLLVDDDPAFRERLAETLRAAGHTVAIACDGTEAHHRLVAKPDGYDVLVSDVTMPGLSGPELVRRSAALAPRLPVVLITGDGVGDIDRDVADRIGRIRHKPFATEDLLTDLQVLVAGR